MMSRGQKTNGKSQFSPSAMRDPGTSSGSQVRGKCLYSLSPFSDS